MAKANTNNAHHHGSCPQQFAVAWDRLLITELEGSSFISRYSYVPQTTHTAIVTHDPFRTSVERRVLPHIW